MKLKIVNSLYKKFLYAIKKFFVCDLYAILQQCTRRYLKYSLNMANEKIHQIDCINHYSFDFKRVRWLDKKD